MREPRLKRYDGGPTHPVKGAVGLSLRDWFAGQTLSGLLQGRSLDFALSLEGANKLASAAYTVADAMLEWREQQ